MTTIHSSNVNDIIYLAPFDPSIEIFPTLRPNPRPAVGYSTPVQDKPRYHASALIARKTTDRERIENL